jgi:hypothetical protein
MNKEKEEKFRQDIDYDQLLGELKQEEPNSAFILMLDDRTQQIVLVWPHVTRRIVSNPIGNKGLHPCWHYTWFDSNEWASLAGVTGMDIFNIFNALAKSMVIYPDGTMPSVVWDFLKLQADKLKVVD